MESINKKQLFAKKRTFLFGWSVENSTMLWLHRISPSPALTLTIESGFLFVFSFAWLERHAFHVRCTQLHFTIYLRLWNRLHPDELMTNGQLFAIFCKQLVTIWQLIVKYLLQLLNCKLFSINYVNLVINFHN